MHRDSLLLSIKCIKGLSIFQVKPRPILSCAGLPGSSQGCAPRQFKPRLDQHVASALRQESDAWSIRRCPGTDSLEEPAANIAPTGACWPPLLKHSGLCLRIKGRPAEAPFISTIKKNKKKNLCQESTLHAVHPLSRLPPEPR